VGKWPYHGEDEIEAVAEVLRSGRTNYWTGENVQAFEKEFAAYVGAKYAIAVTNGTTALELALHGVNAHYDRDEWSYEGSARPRVLCPARTFMATASAIANAGMQPVLCDIETDLNVSVSTLEERYTTDVMGVIVVHYAGLPCNMPEIRAWAEERSLWVIEDSAHAHGAFIGAEHVGTFGDIGCFSFCVGKIMSTGGEGGIVVTNDEHLYRRMAARRDHGRYQIAGSKDMTKFEYSVQEFGSNLRMTEMQSAIGRIQLKKLDGWVARRNEIAARYAEILTEQQPVPSGYRHARYMAIYQVEGRDQLLKALNDRGVPARWGGCPDLRHEPVFGGRQPENPNAEEIGRHTLMLPCYPTYTDAEITDICKILREEI